jgi:bifunctional DNA-binding transcriptional regulator/antitoxin component of YhaV-PrlF toxin-antitoxin module
MTTIVKDKAEVVVPRSIRRLAGIKAGDRLEFKASSRTITITATEPAYKPTKAEAAAIRKGEAEIARGNCGSQQRLEFDHMIPVAIGGASTARNVQLLCEGCNRTKGATLG